MTESSQEGLTSFCKDFEKCLLLLDVKHLGFNPSTFSNSKSGKKKEEEETLFVVSPQFYWKNHGTTSPVILKSKNCFQRPNHKTPQQKRAYQMPYRNFFFQIKMGHRLPGG